QSAHRLHTKKKNIVYIPNKDQRRTGTSLDFKCLYQDDACRIAFVNSGRRCPTSPPAFHGLLGQSSAIGGT
ncbi:unnamed protein product, partial [Staurois parvus]